MIFKMISEMCVGSKYSLDEIIAIVRPVIYVWCVIRFGRKSYFPLKVSFILDLVQGIIGMTRLSMSRQYEDGLKSKK